MFVKRFAVKKRLFYALKAKKILVRQNGAPPHKTAAAARTAYLLTTAAYRYAEAAQFKAQPQTGRQTLYERISCIPT